MKRPPNTRNLQEERLYEKQGGRCPYCKVELAEVNGDGLGYDSELSPILPADHHPALKEVEDTLILACCVCVGIKGNRSLADFLLDPELEKHRAEIRAYQAKRRRSAKV